MSSSRLRYQLFLILNYKRLFPFVRIWERSISLNPPLTPLLFSNINWGKPRLKWYHSRNRLLLKQFWSTDILSLTLFDSKLLIAYYLAEECPLLRFHSSRWSVLLLHGASSCQNQRDTRRPQRGQVPGSFENTQTKALYTYLLDKLELGRKSWSIQIKYWLKSRVNNKNLKEVL